MIIIDDQGNWFIAKDTNGDFKGFRCGHITPEMRKTKVRGGDNEMKSLMFQVINRNEWDTNYDIIEQKNVGFLPEDIPSVNGVQLSFVNIPADGDNIINVQALLQSDLDTPVEGLVAADFQVSNDDVPVTISSVSETSPGVYAITLGVGAEPSEEDKVSVDLYDSVLPSNVVLSNSVLYRSETISEITLS